MTRYLKFVGPDGRTKFKSISSPNENPNTGTGLVVAVVAVVAVVGVGWYLYSKSKTTNTDNSQNNLASSPGDNATPPGNSGSSAITNTVGTATGGLTGNSGVYNPWAGTSTPITTTSAITQQTSSTNVAGGTTFVGAQGANARTSSSVKSPATIMESA